MIDRIYIKGFQAHEGLGLELAPVTVLVGRNDAGKSSVLRALRWAALNAWDGKADDFIHWGQDLCEVALSVDGHEIVRGKGGKANYYRLDGKDLKAFHPGVPRAVEDLLRLGVDNFQSQNDPAYWLTLTAGQAAGALNNIFNLTRVDDAHASLAGDLRQAQAAVRVRIGSLEAARREEASWEWLDEKKATKALKYLEDASREQEGRTKERLRLATLLYEAEKLAKENKGMDVLVSSGEAAAEAGRRVIALYGERERLRGMLDLLEYQMRLAGEVREKEKKLREWLVVCPLCGKGSSNGE